LINGLRDAYQGKAARLTDQEMLAVKTAYQQVLMAKRAEAAKQAGVRNMKDGEAYLAENKKKEGVITTASGLQYKVLKAGTGKQPKATDTVKVHYRGTLTDGKEFDSSYKRGEPASFPVGQVVPGWTEALQLMKEGAKWQLTVPASLAYGERGRPGIGPNQVLLFDVELLEVLPAK
jgi:FKBP-type peptidyl-prolyl cis-trans isomerase